MAGPLQSQGAFLRRHRMHGRLSLSHESEHGQVLPSRFRAAKWLGNRHLQTIYPSLPFPRGPRPPLKREVLELPDGDITVVDRLATGESLSGDRPLLVVLHGLESSAESSYARHLLDAADRHGWHGAVLHFRDCGDYRNRLPRRYHAGETNDLRYFLNKLRTEGYAGPILAVGYSLGGNVLLKYLGEDHGLTPVRAAVAVCVPLSLQRCADALETGFARVYQRHLLKRMKKAVSRKFNPHTAAFDWERAMRATTFGEFDDAVTAPLHGFAGKDEYYETCSSIGFLRSIERPTLIINARDDPFMMPDMLPGPEELSRAVTLEISEAGGHVGFVDGGTPWKPHFYLPPRIIGFLEEQLAGLADAPGAMPSM